MAQDPEIPQRELSSLDLPTPAPVAKKSFKRRHWGKLTLFFLVVVPVGALIAWSYAAMSYTYSSGIKAGYVQKLSKKGWLCKTWEGEQQLSSIPGSAPQLFLFTVQDDSVARAIEGMMGKRVELQYEQHPGVPLSCFGDTEYFVVGVKLIDGGSP